MLISKPRGQARKQPLWSMDNEAKIKDQVQERPICIKILTSPGAPDIQGVTKEPVEEGFEPRDSENRRTWGQFH